MKTLKKTFYILIAILILSVLASCTKTDEDNPEPEKLTNVTYDIDINTPYGHEYSLSIDYQTASGETYHKLRYYTEPKDTVITIIKNDITYTAVEVLKLDGQDINGKITVYFNNQLKEVALPETNKITFYYGNYIR